MWTLLAAEALAILTPGWRVSTEPFDPRGDVATIAACRTVYERLEPLSARLLDREGRTAGVVQSYRGGRRIAPFVAAAGEDAVNNLLQGNNNSEIRVGLSVIVQNAQEEDSQTDSNIVAARTYRNFATRCDQQLTAWGAPADAAVPPAVAASGSAELRINNKTAADTFAEPATAALARAACDGDTAAVARAVASGGQPNGVGLRDLTPLAWTVACENIAGITALLDAGANPNQALGESGTPVMIAATYHNPDLLRLMLRRGGDPNAQSGSDSALSKAFEQGVFTHDFTNYETLLAAGADINLRFNGNDETIVDYMTTFRRYEEIYRLLQRGYAGDLVQLGAQVTMDERLIDTITPGVRPWIMRVKAFLVEHGVRFPVPGLYTLERDARGFYIQR